MSARPKLYPGALEKYWAFATNPKATTRRRRQVLKTLRLCGYDVPNGLPAVGDPFPRLLPEPAPRLLDPRCIDLATVPPMGHA